MLGHIYRKQQALEQAYRYFDEGLETAKKLNNIKHEGRFLRNKGLIHRDKGEYRQAKEYFDLALTIQVEPEDRMRTYLSYARLYRTMNLPDSTLYYLNTIEDQIREITFPNTRRDIYTELVTYYKSNRGDGDKIVLYSQLAHTEDLQIKKSLSEKKIASINKQLEQLKQKKQTEGQTYRRIFDYGLIAILLTASLLAAIWFSSRQLKEKYKQTKEKYGDIRNQQFTQTVDQLRLALDGLNSVAQSIDDLDQKELAYAGSPAWEQLLILREKFSIQLAAYAKIKLEKMPNGAIVLSKLTSEDLSILQLSRFRVTNENIGWMLGYKGNTKEQVTLRKEQIRKILTEAGMNEKEIKTFFIIEG